MAFIARILAATGLGLVVGLIVLSCGKKDTAGDTPKDSPEGNGIQAVAMPALPPDSSVHLNSLTAAGREISIETNLWYNLMPGPDDEAAPELNLQVRLMTEEKTTVPADYVIDYVWVTMGGGTWGIAPEEEQIGSGPTRERMFRGGPLYDAETGARTKELPPATVTARVSDKDGRYQYLRKVDQPVERVY
jgi:hypothetical protein